jgi:hypothetical protein
MYIHRLRVVEAHRAGRVDRITNSALKKKAFVQTYSSCLLLRTDPMAYPLDTPRVTVVLNSKQQQTRPQHEKAHSELSRDS